VMMSSPKEVQEGLRMMEYRPSTDICYHIWGTLIGFEG